MVKCSGFFGYCPPLEVKVATPGVPLALQRAALAPLLCPRGAEVVPKAIKVRIGGFKEKWRFLMGKHQILRVWGVRLPWLQALLPFLEPVSPHGGRIHMFAGKWWLEVRRLLSSPWAPCGARGPRWHHISISTPIRGGFWHVS